MNLRFYAAAIGLTLLAPPFCFAEAPGVTRDTIVLGQSAALTGPAAAIGQAMRDGALTYFEHVNATGGIHGRKIKLVTLDDGFEPDQTKQNTRKLIHEQRAFALFGYTGTASSYAALPIFSYEGVPFFAPYTGTEGLRIPFNRFVFNIRASYADETERMVDWLVSQRQSRIAVFYEADSHGQAGLEGVQNAMERRKLKVAAKGSVWRNTTDVKGAVTLISPEKPQAVIMISTYKAAAEFIREYTKTGERPQFLNVSLVGAKALASELGRDAHGVIVSQVVPYPMYPSGIAREMRARASSRQPNYIPTYNDIEGYIAAKAFAEGLRRAGPDLTRENFIAALESFRDVDLGQYRLSFSPSDHTGSKHVEMTVAIGTGGFLPIAPSSSVPARKASTVQSVVSSSN
jgi:ABC-type branched-subunit amino acid transport system substrate-binding protein